MPESDFAIPGLMPLDHPVYNASRAPEQIIILIVRGEDLRYSIPVPPSQDPGEFDFLVWGFRKFYDELIEMEVVSDVNGSTIELSAAAADLMETCRLSFGFAIFRTIDGVRSRWRHGYIYTQLGLAPEDAPEEP